MNNVGSRSLFSIAYYRFDELIGVASLFEVPEKVDSATVLVPVADL